MFAAENEQLTVDPTNAQAVQARQMPLEKVSIDQPPDACTAGVLKVTMELLGPLLTTEMMEPVSRGCDDSKDRRRSTVGPHCNEFKELAAERRTRGKWQSDHRRRSWRGGCPVDAGSEAIRSGEEIPRRVLSSAGVDEHGPTDLARPTVGVGEGHRNRRSRGSDGGHWQRHRRELEDRRAVVDAAQTNLQAEGIGFDIPAQGRDGPSLPEGVEDGDILCESCPGETLSSSHDGEPSCRQLAHGVAHRLLLGRVGIGGHRSRSSVHATLIVGVSDAAERTAHGAINEGIKLHL